MRVRYTLPAARSLERALAHIAEHSPVGAQHVQARIQSMIETLSQFPRAGSPTRRRGVRRIVVAPYPYLIFYSVIDDELVIDAIRHAARRPVSR